MKCAVTINVNGRRYRPGRRAAAAPRPLPARCRADRHQDRLRHQPVRRLHGADRRRRREVVHDARGAGRRRERHDHRGAGAERRAHAAAGRVLGEARAAVRLLHAGHGLRRARDPAHQSEPVGRADPPRPRRQHVPLHRLSEHRPRGAGGRGRSARAPGSEADDDAPARRRRASSDPASGGARIRGCSPAPRATPPTSRCRAWCTPRSCAARTGTRASAASTPAAAKSAPGVVAVFTGADTEAALKCIPCAWLLPNAGLKVAPYRAHGHRRRPLRRRRRRRRRRRVRVSGLRRARADRRRLRAAAGGRRSAESRRGRARRSCTRTRQATSRSTGRWRAATSTPRSPRRRSWCAIASSSSG